MLQKLCLLLCLNIVSYAQAEQNTAANRLSSLIKKTLSEKFADAEIRIPSLDALSASPAISSFKEIKSAHVIEDRANGVAVIELLGTNQDEKEKTETIQTPFEAWKRVPVAVHRIYPNTKLKNEDFRIQEVNVASGQAREYRGVMVSPDTKLDSLQSKQTILENQFVVISAIEKQPDLRKGETVKLELISGELTLTTQAVAEESGSIGDSVRVITLKSKRELTGKIKEDHSVEVNL